MKRIIAVIVAIALVGVSPLMIGVAFADTQRGTGVINAIKFIDTNEPDDLSLQIDDVNYGDNIGGYLRHILGTERGNKFLADQNAVYAQYENCESVPKEEYEACHAEADKASAELYLEYLIYPVEIIDIQMMSGGSVFESGVAYADLSIYLEKVQREYDIVLGVADGMDYNISLEPLVVRKIKDETYENAKNVRYVNNTNELRFETGDLSEYMVGFRLVENNDNNNDDNDDNDDDDDESFQDRLVSADNLPTDTKLVIRSLKGLDESEMMMLIYGEDVNSKFEAINEKLEEAEGNEDEFYQIIADLYDDIGILALFEADRDLLDIFLVNANTGEKVPYNGNGITIRYKFDADFDKMEGLEEFYKYSSRKWSPAVVHVKDDGSREYLPATITDGVWEFTTDSFSTFFPALVADIETKAPSTLDDNRINIGIAMISIVSLFTLGIWISKIERR